MCPASLMIEAAMREHLGDSAHVRKRLSGASERTRERCPDAREDHLRRIASKYTWPGSNWRPSACEADVIATRPQVHVQCLPVENHVAEQRASVIDVRVLSGSRIKRRRKPPWQLNTRLHCRDRRRRPRQAACRWRPRLAAPHRARAANRGRCNTFAWACRCNSRGLAEHLSKLTEVRDRAPSRLCILSHSSLRTRCLLALQPDRLWKNGCYGATWVRCANSRGRPALGSAPGAARGQEVHMVTPMASA